MLFCVAIYGKCANIRIMKISKQEAIQSFGGVKKLADALGIQHSAVCQWGEFVPALRAYQIRELMNQTTQTDASKAVA
jgi:DNA-binding transcriptional regulator YdaS (Cro superfamily)